MKDQGLVDILEVLEDVVINVFLIMKPLPYIVTDGGDSIESPSFYSGTMEKGCVSIPKVNPINQDFIAQNCFSFNNKVFKSA